jgi:hypothetical protein
MNRIIMYETTDSQRFFSQKEAQEHEDVNLIFASMVSSKLIPCATCTDGARDFYSIIVSWLKFVSTRTDIQRALLRAAKIDYDKLKAEDICKGSYKNE